MILLLNMTTGYQVQRCCVSILLFADCQGKIRVKLALVSFLDLPQKTHFGLPDCFIAGAIMFSLFVERNNQRETGEACRSAILTG
jgi:hypothetical protein